ncbi:hypothetical protein DFH06DRAFT_1119026 [Mycena polygramma]|nr:hypothetical protein DFH06DRAFT_1119026 [Mycena polygramma]
MAGSAPTFQLSTLSPSLQSFPPEVLARILWWTFGSCDHKAPPDFRTRHAALHVNTTWRRTVLHQPDLWNILDIDNVRRSDLSAFSLALERSGKIPLQLSIALFEPVTDLPSRIFFQRFHSALESAFQRCRRFALRCNYGRTLDAFLEFSLRTSCPNLRYLEVEVFPPVHLGGEDMPDRAVAFAGNMPCLQVLSIWWSFVPWRLTTLNELHLHQIALYLDVTLDDMKRVLEASPLLAVLSLHRVECALYKGSDHNGIRVFSPATDRITLPALTRLSLVLGTPSSEQLLRALNLPSLHTLRWTVEPCMLGRKTRVFGITFLGTVRRVVVGGAENVLLLLDVLPAVQFVQIEPSCSIDLFYRVLDKLTSNGPGGTMLCPNLRCIVLREAFALTDFQLPISARLSARLSNNTVSDISLVLPHEYFAVTGRWIYHKFEVVEGSFPGSFGPGAACFLLTQPYLVKLEDFDASGTHHHILDLPFSVLRQILMSFHKGRMKPAWTCQLFRRIVFNTPELWSRLYVDERTDLEELAVWIRRSKGPRSPDFDVECFITLAMLDEDSLPLHYYPPMCLDVEFFTSGSYEAGEMVPSHMKYWTSVLELIGTVFPRCSTLTLSATTPGQSRFFIDRLATMKSDTLKSFKLSLCGVHSSYNSYDFLAGLPSLRSLYFVDSWIHCPINGSPSLTYLSLYHCTSVQDAPSSLKMLEFTVDDDDDEFAPLVMHNLTDIAFHWDGDSSSTNTLLSRISLPVLRTVVLCVSSRRSADFESTIKIWREVLASATTLSVQFELNTDDFVRLLECVPLLEHLEIHTFGDTEPYLMVHALIMHWEGLCRRLKTIWIDDEIVPVILDAMLLRAGDRHFGENLSIFSLFPIDPKTDEPLVLPVEVRALDEALDRLFVVPFESRLVNGAIDRCNKPGARGFVHAAPQFFAGMHMSRATGLEDELFPGIFPGSSRYASPKLWRRVVYNRPSADNTKLISEEFSVKIGLIWWWPVDGSDNDPLSTWDNCCGGLFPAAAYDTVRCHANSEVFPSEYGACACRVSLCCGEIAGTSSEPMRRRVNLLTNTVFPPEILGFILQCALPFQSVRDMQDYAGRQQELMDVCPQWKDVIVGEPSIWACIFVDNYRNCDLLELESRILRSQQHPLFVSVGVWAFVAWLHPSQNEYLRQVATSLSTFGAVERCGRLQIFAPTVGVLQRLVSSFPPVPWPILQDVEIRIGDTDSFRGVLEFPLSSPALRHVRSVRALVTPTLTTITELVLSRLSSRHRIRWFELKDVLLRSTSLTCLRLADVSYTGGDDAKPVCLPFVTRFSFTASHPDKSNLHILGPLRLPLLHTFECETWSAGWLALLAHPMTLLKQARVGVYSFDPLFPSNLLQVLHHSPVLQQLDLRGTAIYGSSPSFADLLSAYVRDHTLIVMPVCNSLTRMVFGETLVPDLIEALLFDRPSDMFHPDFVLVHPKNTFDEEDFITYEVKGVRSEKDGNVLYVKSVDVPDLFGV